MRRSAFLLLLIASHTLACSSPEGRPLEIATTTSVVNSGLLGFVLRLFDHPFVFTPLEAVGLWQCSRIKSSIW